MFLNVNRGQRYDSFSFEIFDAIDKLNKKDWNHVLAGRNPYLSLEYLSALERSLEREIGFKYYIFYDEMNSPVGIAVTQLLSFIDRGYTDNPQVCSLREKIKRRHITGTGTKVLTCGNSFASGENGFLFLDEIPYSEISNIVSKALKQKNSVALLKEFWPETFENARSFEEQKFTEFAIDVNMVMKIPSNWNSMNDYLDSMVTKYRSKAKNAYHKSFDLQVQDFQVSDIQQYKAEITRLYLLVVDKSPFQFGELNGDSFVYFKQNLGEKFVLRGYFLKNKLVGFSSAFLFDSILDANFVGIEYSLNSEFAIYQRMLYDFVDLAIQRRCNEIRLGRTAEEIKSSIGAVPIPMKLFIKHHKFIQNWILKSIISKTRPSDFGLRKPFKVGR